MYLIVYVDDIMIASSDKRQIDELLSNFKSKFNIHEMGEPKRFLGLNIHRDRKKKVIYVEQKDYIDAALDRFGLANSHGMDKLHRYLPMESEPVDPNILEQMLGVLQYLACRTRPDIAYIVNRLSQDVPKANQHLLKSARNVFKYLKATRDTALILGDLDKHPLVLSVDASFNQETKSRSRSGCIAKVFGSTVFWSSHIQSLQALSTAEAELNALVSACEELDWLQPIMSDFMPDVKPIILEDNQAVIAMLDRPRNKRFELRVDYITERMARGDIGFVQYQPTDQQPADVLTKVVNHNVNLLLGLIKCPLISHRGMLTMTYWSH